MTSKFHKHFLSEKASHRLVIFCTILLIIALIATFISFFIPETAAKTTLNPAPQARDASGYKTAQLSIGDTSISVEISDTEALQNHGLSDRKSLDADKGMLFVFPNDATPGFWMKNMNFPLDIIWIDNSGTVVDITPNFSPDSYPEIVTPKSSIRYVLEVNAGFADMHHIVVGSRAKML